MLEGARVSLVLLLQILDDGGGHIRSCKDMSLVVGMIGRR